MTDTHTEALVERVALAMQNAELNDGDEGNTYRLFDLLGFSGENKAVMITRQLARAAIEALPARNDERALKLELEPFPMLNGEPAIPYYLARIVYEAYGTSGQSLERIKERGGFGWAEVSHLFKELRRKNERLHKALREQSFAALADTQPSGFPIGHIERG
jgi:hypothetical protein